MASAPPAVPFSLTHYELGALLGRGGLGAVYEARDTRDGSTVAVKLLEDPSPRARVRFARECAIASSLRHPRIVAVRDHGVLPDGTPWLAMERLRGEDLADRLARAPLSPREALALARQVCEALAFAHARTVIHRDLKPHNLFVCEGESLDVKVLDFGLARVDGDATVTSTGAVAGTLSYVSPEQARGAGDLDASTDLWSLGVTLYECVAGVVPFRAPHDAGVLFQIVFGPSADLASAVPSVPPRFADFVRELLSRARERRPTALAALATLDALAEESHEWPSHTAFSSDLGESLTSRDDDRARAERRLVCALHVRARGDLGDALEEARAFGGHVTSHDATGFDALFGDARWMGDESLRATRFAWSLSRRGHHTGVATVRSDDGHQQPLALARNLALTDGIAIDENTAWLVREHFSTRASGTNRVLVEGPTMPDDARRPWVGRQTELSLLHDAVTQAADASRPSAVVILGPKGMGRSRLCAEALRRLPDAVGACRVFATACAYYRRDVPLAALRDALGDRWSAAQEAIEGTRFGDGVAALDRVRLAVMELLRSESREGPAVLAFDDAQWIDASTRSVLRWLGQVDAAPPVAVWFFAQPEARESLLEVISGATARALGPLSRAHSEALLRALYGESSAAVLDRAGGHPLFLEELGRLRDGRDAALPLSVQATLLASLDQLDATDRDFLKRAAVAGRSFWPEAVAEMGGDTEVLPRLVHAQVLAGVERSRRAGLAEYTFRNALLQELAYDLWPAPERRSLHATMAAWLDARADVAAAERAQHWDLAGDSDRAAARWVSAAEEAAWISDAEITRAHVDRALERTTDVGLRWRALVAQDTALQIAGDRRVQSEGLDMMELLAPSLGPDAEAEACWRRCYFARMTGQHEAVFSVGTRGIELARTAGSHRWEALLHDELAVLLTDEGRRDEARTHATQAESLAVAANDPWLAARTAATHGYQELETGDARVALARFDEAATGFAAQGDRRREALVKANAGYALLRLGRVDEALTRFEDAITRSREVGNARTVAMATHNRATLRRMRGDLHGARADLDLAERESVRLGHVRLTAATRIERAYLALQEGSVGSIALADAAEHAADASRSPALVASARSVALRLRALAGDDVTARITDAEALFATLDRTPETAAELAVALFSARAERAEDGARAREAIEAFVRSLGEEVDALVARQGFAARYLSGRCDDSG